MDTSLREVLREIKHAISYDEKQLDLSTMMLRQLPAEIGAPVRLRELNLSDNELTSLPSEIGNLVNLKELHLDGNRLKALPPEIGQLKRLIELDLRDNNLTTLPAELGQLPFLTTLTVDGNPLVSPPPEITRQGTYAILRYLREQLEAGERQWVSKLMLVGEGGVGKTSLLRRLRGEGFNTNENTTHGIEIYVLELEHPSEQCSMKLNTWDFGGQEIYHATHQFFLTNRSLFMLSWNARLGFEQGKLHYWLDTIKALAPESPIILVATHIDERSADLPLGELHHKYPQIVDQVEVSSLTGTGIKELGDLIQQVAVRLPLMGEMWPARWLNAANNIRDSQLKHIAADKLWKVMDRHGVPSDSQPLLATWLHELGDTLFFQDDDELGDTVILKPQWVSQYISRVLESENVIGDLGIFTRTHMSEIWDDIEPLMRERFLRLMEKFDLSYRIPEDPEHRSLVVERLSYDEADYHSLWTTIKKRSNCKEIRMKYVFQSSMPAGIPTWFIARTHRFTTNTHWRFGSLFADDKKPTHLGLIRAYPHQRYVELSVRGPYPQTFFTILRDGFELTLGRFPGLEVERRIPCPGHNGTFCPHEFNYEDLIARINRSNPKYLVECPKTFDDVDVRQLLFGLSSSTLDDVLRAVEKAEKEDRKRQESLLTWLQLEFAKQDKRAQSIPESHCPRVFTLTPYKVTYWLEDIAIQKMELQLYCEAPGQWHKTKESEGGRYIIKKPTKWLQNLTPHIRRMVKFLKFATPLVGPGVGVVADDYLETIKAEIELLEALVNKMPEIQISRQTKLSDSVGTRSHTSRAEGASLRTLRKLLDELDPQQHWGGLKKVLTPEGHYLWLCAGHAKEYDE